MLWAPFWSNTDFYRGECASAIHMRSMLQASRGRWGIAWVLWTLLRLPLVSKTSIISCRLVSHRIGSPNKTTAVFTDVQRRELDLVWHQWHEKADAISEMEEVCVLTVNLREVANKVWLKWKMRHWLFTTEEQCIFVPDFQYLTGSLGLLLWSTMSSKGNDSLSISILTTFSKPRLKAER